MLLLVVEGSLASDSVEILTGDPPALVFFLGRSDGIGFPGFAVFVPRADSYAWLETEIECK